MGTPPQPPAGGRVSTHDLARLAGVNQSTVSRALRNDPRISKEVRERVQQVAAEQGYRPDPMLAALAQYKRERATAGRNSTLAWLNFFRVKEELYRYREFKLYWEGAREEADRAGYRLEEFAPRADGLTAERMETILLTRNINGVLIPPCGGLTEHDLGSWQHFHWEEFSVVKFGYSIRSLSCHIVAADQMTDGVIAVRAMRERGYRRIGLVTGSWTTTRFVGGYAAEFIHFPPAERLQPLVLETDSGPATTTTFARWIKSQRPDAILTDVPNLQVIIKSLGLRIPGDLALASTSVLDGGTDAGIYQNSHEIGRAAVQMVISLINHNQRGFPATCRELLVEGRWQDGKTVPFRKATPKKPARK